MAFKLSQLEPDRAGRVYQPAPEITPQPIPPRGEEVGKNVLAMYKRPRSVGWFSQHNDIETCAKSAQGVSFETEYDFIGRAMADFDSVTKDFVACLDRLLLVAGAAVSHQYKPGTQYVQPLSSPDLEYIRDRMRLAGLLLECLNRMETIHLPPGTITEEGRTEAAIRLHGTWKMISELQKELNLQVAEKPASASWAATLQSRAYRAVKKAIVGKPARQHPTPRNSAVRAAPGRSGNSLL